MRLQLLLALMLITNTGCFDAEETTLVQGPLRSAPTQTVAGASVLRSQPTTVVSRTEITGWASAARSGSLILLPNDGLPIVPGLSLESEFHLSVTGTIARVQVRQRFSNPTDSWVEGIYVFPLPDDAAVDQMRILTDGRVIEGKIQEKEEARKTYEAAKQDGRRAGLVVQERPNVFTTSIANLRPGSDITVEIEYQQSVRLDNGEFSLRVPIVVGPLIGQALNGIEIVGVALAIPAVVLLSGEGRLPKPGVVLRSPVLGLAVVVGTSVGTAGLLLTQASPEAGEVPAFAVLMTGVMVMPWILRQRTGSFWPEREILGFGSVLGVSSAVAFVLSTAAYLRGSAAIVTALIAMSPGVSVLISWRFLGERIYAMQVLGGAFGMAAVTAFALAG